MYKDHCEVVCLQDVMCKKRHQIYSTAVFSILYVEEHDVKIRTWKIVICMYKKIYLHNVCDVYENDFRLWLPTAFLVIERVIKKVKTNV